MNDVPAGRPRPLVVAVALVLAVIAATTLALLLVSKAGASPPKNQCSLPVSQRTGGWFCPGS